MTYSYEIRGKPVQLRADCWALHYENREGRACRVVDPRADAARQVLVDLDGFLRWVSLDLLVAPHRSRPF